MSALEGVCTSLQAQQVVNRWSLNADFFFFLPRKEFFLSPNKIFNIHLQRALGHGILGVLAPLIINA